MAAPDVVVELVKRFDMHRASYRGGEYKEDRLRKEFLDPFFEALGWDVYNKKGYAEAYKEVVHEASVKVGGQTKAPDYCFRAGGGVRSFFVEAKKPAVDIRDAVSPAFQLRRYAWSAKLPVSILTDFEEFAVYDCRVRPDKNDKAAKARVIYWRYTEYVERWDELVGLFSPEAIRQGALDRFAASKKLRRGTAEVDAAFLDEIESWRTALAKNIARRNPNLSQRDLNFAVGRTIDRIIFLRICEDRGIERYGRLLGLLNGQSVYGRLAELFQHADDRYNSGLFHFAPERDRPEPPDELTLGLTIDDKTLKTIITGLYYPDSPYEFSVLGADILGQVYEQFLGKVIRLTPSHQARVDPKPEVKKAGGVYYTPGYIVDYIVRHTVGKLVDEKTPRQVAKLKIVDPACGSGSFLLGAYQYLLDWHRKYYEEHDPRRHARGRSPRLRLGPTGDWRLTTAEKKRILLGNIHGVDIDPQAVEVTKLSLLLKVLEGESQETLDNLFRHFHERALPDLAANIKCGNSLIGQDFYKNQQMNLLDEEEVYRINAFDWRSEFPEVFKGKNPGFDAVIGNPPYVVLGKDIFSEAVVDYLQRYEVAEYKMDLFHLFIQKGTNLLAKNGRFGYIVPNPWLTLKFTDRLRKHVIENTEIAEIVVFEHRVFEAADVHTALVFFVKRPPSHDHIACVKRPPDTSDALVIERTPCEHVSQQDWATTEGYRIETRLVGKLGDLVRRLLDQHPPLNSVARASLGCQAYNRTKHTTQQIADRVFHATSKLAREYMPELAGKDVARYSIDRRRGQWIKYGPWLHDYRSLDWLQGPRILIREIPGLPPYRFQACYTEKTYCNYKTILNVNPSETTEFSMKYLLGILNSRLISFLYPYASNKMLARSFPRISVGDLRALPISCIDFSDRADKTRHDRMVELVERMLSLPKRLPAAKTAHQKTVLKRQIEATDHQIDRLVYELYELTDEEIAIVEEATT